MVPQQYCLRWKHHHTNVQSMFSQLLEKERFCDVTLYCLPNLISKMTDKGPVDADSMRGVSLRAHRVVLAACSEMLGALLGAHESLGEPVLVVDGAEPDHVRALLEYMYTGEMSVHASQLAGLLKTAEELRIKGLTDIRWNNKNEPPDCETGAVTTTPALQKKLLDPELPNKTDNEIQDTHNNSKEKICVNGGPPPLIKLPVKDKLLRRENSDAESSSPKRRRIASGGTENTDDDEDRDAEWQHGNMDITAERVSWGHKTSVRSEQDAVESRETHDQGQGQSHSQAPGRSQGHSQNADGENEVWSREGSEDEWNDHPTDIGSFLHTSLTIDHDQSADDESNDEAPPSTSSSAGTSAVDLKLDSSSQSGFKQNAKVTMGPKSGPSDPRFTDVMKLNDYLRHGRRPQFWEEPYVKRVMEAVRIKELEMKQAAEILGVSYGTLYGRYRDVYGCINRPYRWTLTSPQSSLNRGSAEVPETSANMYSTARDFWQGKGPAEVLERLQRGDMSIDAGALALGVSPTNLAAYIADMTQAHEKEFEPIPIEIDPSLKVKAQALGASPPLLAGLKAALKRPSLTSTLDKNAKKVLVASMTDDDQIPAAVIAHDLKKTPASSTITNAQGTKWPSIRVANLETLRSPESTSTITSAAPASPTLLMRSRPDLTIVAAAKKPEPKRDENGT